MRRAGRVDLTQHEIVKALRSCGARVLVLSAVGKGCPDLLVGWRGENTLLECKTGNASLTTDEKEFHATWPGKLAIVRTPEEAVLAVIGA